jgi:Flp pilus assembly protein TadG
VRVDFRGVLHRRPRSAEGGQSLVEFALVLPMLLVLLLGLADFGRVFAAGITVEAAARNAAEAAAQEYVQLIRANGTLQANDYRDLHHVALASLCHESTVLPNFAGAGNTCTMPVAAVCVHDAAGVAFGPDPYCGQDAASPPAQCTSVQSTAGWTTNNAEGSGSLAYVEVRVCYRFTTLFNLQNLHLPMGSSLSLGDVYLQRTRIFTVACYYSAGC